MECKRTFDIHWCDTHRAVFGEGEQKCNAVHEHEWGLRVNGLAHCRRPLCEATDYDSMWGAGMFNDWPRGTRKGYGR